MAEAVTRRCQYGRSTLISRMFAGSLVCAALLPLLPLCCVAQAAPAQAQQVPQVVMVPSTPVQTTATGTDWSQTAQNSARTPVAVSTADGAQRPEVPAPPSEFQQLVSRTIGISLPVFGSDLFRNAPSTFAPVTGAQVTSDYVIGPGDEIRLSATGQLNQQGSFTVDRAGTISIPEVGTVTVAGLRFDDLKPFLVQQLGRVYRNFQLSVTLGQLRAIQIYVTGQARRPGSYTVSSLSTLLNAVFASGGVLPGGSMRTIQLQRGGATVTTFDLYDLLLRGDKSRDVTLKPGDVIFIPKAGPQVAAVGSVTTPAIYELRGETTVTQLLQLANGATNTALESNARVESIFNHAQRTVTEVNLRTDGDRPLHDGDILTVSPITGQFQNAVTLRGNVTFPGRYPWHSGMRVTDVIPNREALLTREYFQARNDLGQSRGLSFTAVPATPDPGAGPGGQANSSALPPSTVSAPGASSGNTSNTNGSGTSVGDALTQNNGTFRSTTTLLLSAPDVDLSYAVIERLNKETLTTFLVPFNLGKALAGDSAQNLPLEPGDVLTVFSEADIRVPQSQQTRYVRLEGEFAGSGIYSVLPGETLRQLVARAGGLTPDAYLYASEFSRESTRRVEKQRLNEYADTLETQINNQIGSQVASNTIAGGSNDAAALNAAAASTGARSLVARLRAVQPTGRIVLNLKPTSSGLEGVPDLPLEDGDRFIVPRQPTTVTVTGEVYNASAFLFEPGKEVRDYLKEAGGPQRDADSKRMFVVRADGSVVSSQYNHAERAMIFPGDTIILPPQITHGNILRNTLLVTSLLGSIGTPLSLIALLRN